MIKYFKLAWRNMWRNWRRTLIASVAIVLGLILLIFMDSLIRGSDQAIYGNAVRLYGGNVQVHAPGYRDMAKRLPLLPLADGDFVVEKVSEQPNVLNASKRINTGGMVSSREGAQPVNITAIEPESESAVSLVAENITLGRFLTAEDRDSILISQELADLLDVSVNDRITLMGRRMDQSMRQRTMDIVGIFDLGMGEAERGLVYINLPAAQTLYDLRDEETEVAVTLEQIGQEDELIASLEPELSGYEIDSFYTLQPEIQQALATKSSFTAGLGFIVLLMASIGIFNIMLMAVYERTREMGVLGALGMKGRQLMSLFMLEGTFIGLFSAILGCTLSWLLVRAVASVGLNWGALVDTSGAGDVYALVGDVLYPSIPLVNIIYYGVAVIIIAAVASLVPALQAVRSEPAESLHHV
ncbi:MAG: ABC transporter permease [Candidatus Promineifilaceae bacterium]|jgi:ABC-type lipoprotein release transport system permease subunit